MAFTTGSVTGTTALLNALATWLVGTAGWTQLEHIDGVIDTVESRYRFRAPGYGATQRVFLNFRTLYDSANTAYVIEAGGATGDGTGMSWGSEPNAANQMYLSLSNINIDYWFYANDRRVIIVCKIGTVYVSMYAGFLLPWAAPSDTYQYPLYICGTYPTPRPYNFSGLINSSCVDPRSLNTDASTASGKVRDPLGNWRNVSNGYNSGGTLTKHKYSTIGSIGANCWPFGQGIGSDDVNVGDRSWNYQNSPSAIASEMVFAVNTAQGERVLLPCMINSDLGPLGTVDGIFWPCGTAMVPESTVTVGGNTHRAFQSVSASDAKNIFVVLEN